MQAAWLAERAGEQSEVILAALLHDIGHLLLQEEEVDELHSPRDHFHEVLGGPGEGLERCGRLVGTILQIRLHGAE